MGQPNGDPAAGDGGNTGEGGKGDDGGKAPEGFKPVTYKTREEMDAAFSERATRAANSAKAEALKMFTEAGVDPAEAVRLAQQAKDEEEAKKSPAKKAQERAETAEAELAKFRAKEARGTLAAEVAKTVKFGETPLPASLLAGDTKEEIESHAKALVEFFNSVGGPRGPRYNPDQGHNGNDETASADPIRTYMASGSFI